MKLLGIVGGIGPEASNKFCELLVKHKSKERDQDNIPFVNYCNPQIPDRTDFILGKGDDPTPEFVRSCKELEKMNVDFIVMPCNTAHCFLPQIQEEVSVPIVDMTKLLVRRIIRDNPSIERVGVLATTGSVKSKLFENYFGSVGIEVVVPDEFDQENLVMEAIYGERGIKAGKKLYARELLNVAARKLVDKGVQAIVLGCTEIPLVLRQKDLAIQTYDPMEIVAREIIDYVDSKEDKEVVTFNYVIPSLIDK